MRLRRAGPVSPEVERHLRALDAALADEPVDAELTEWADLALMLQAERPVPPEEFVRALDARATAGFPKSRAVPASKPRRRRALPLALGTGAAVFILVTVGVTSGLFSDGGGHQRSTPAASDKQAMPLRSPRPTDSAGASQGPPPGALSTPAFAPNAPVRKVERAATITLSAPRDEVESVADSVIRTADRYGGFVLNSSVSSGDRDVGATINLRIPARGLQQAIADLSKLAHVKARSQSALDITDRFSAPRRALADAIAERQALLAQLARAVTPNETASIRARLRLANHRINAARLTLRKLGVRVGYSAVSVTVEPGSRAASGGSWTVGDAFGDARGILGVGAGVLVIALAVLVPLTLLLALGWAGRRAYLRHVRNGALSSVEKPSAR